MAHPNQEVHGSSLVPLVSLCEMYFEHKFTFAAPYGRSQTQWRASLNASQGFALYALCSSAYVNRLNFKLHPEGEL